MGIEEEKFFNINSLLKNVFHALDQKCEERNTDLVFIFGKSVPCQLKGPLSDLYIVLIKMVCEILQNYDAQELLLTVSAPEEFLYKEPVSFQLSNLAHLKETAFPKLQEELADDLNILDAIFEYIDDNGGSFILTLPLTTAELGCRRHYRMPSKEMLNKNILLIIESHTLALSLTKMFKYFPMNIDLSLKKFDENRYDLAAYDLVLIEDKVFDFQLYDLVSKIKKENDVKFVLLGDEDLYESDDDTKPYAVFLEKPVTQESVFKLLIKLFK